MTREEAIKFAEYAQIMADGKPDVQEFYKLAESALWQQETVTDSHQMTNAPTVDAVSVVRCRECKHWKPSGSKAGNSFSDMEYIGGCEFTNYYRRESDFCSYGERKEGAEQ